ncbi:MAG: 23S rRNA (uracil(1939)-C(5))-methyltransferase RlmD [Bacteroidetes bacterium]|nr:23S rRNA (uracil(1939)-C(5))-methyltransferase RlmD [Bacteroidota bacterium]MCL6100933.1 23S rRNA (uracil(1939)-C(5))-methyltransferase RlmD [Bacteroidota bacterium]
MGRNTKNLPLLQNVEILDAGAEGKAVARVEGIVVFTTNVIPGDVVDIQVTKKREKYMEGKVVAVRTPSPDRVEAFCEHFDLCGGCKWQYLPYEKQLFYKQKQVVDQLTRIGRVNIPKLHPITGSEKTTFYRNKLEFTFSNRRWLSEEEIRSGAEINDQNVLGFHIPGMFDKVMDIKTCWLQASPSNEIRNAVRGYALEHQLPFFDLRNKSGLLRTLTIRTNEKGEVMVIFVFFVDDRPAREGLLSFVAEGFPQITSLLYVINEKGNDTITDQEIQVYKGKDHLVEEMEGLKFIVGAKSFYQTNSTQAYELYKITREMAGLTGAETVYDLYTGTGTIANFVAKKAKKVIGIEYVPEAIDDAKINSVNNGINNAYFFAGDMKDILTAGFIAENGRPDVIITDPPRAGMDEKVVRVILAASPDRIVYVSCNPATQARDLQLMQNQYAVKEVLPVDMFPHTHHVENVVLLEKIVNTI